MVALVYCYTDDGKSQRSHILTVVIICILVSLVIHEFMHAYVGHALGDNTASEEGRLTLNPFSHIDPFMTIASTDGNTAILSARQSWPPNQYRSILNG